MKQFKFELNKPDDNMPTVRVVCSGEAGKVVGRAEYAIGEDAYLLRYKAGDGRAVESWWPESALEKI
jgi:hypothetical protein